MKNNINIYQRFVSGYVANLMLLEENHDKTYMQLRAMANEAWKFEKIKPPPWKSSYANNTGLFQKEFDTIETTLTSPYKELVTCTKALYLSKRKQNKQKLLHFILPDDTPQLIKEYIAKLDSDTPFTQKDCEILMNLVLLYTLRVRSI